MKQTLFFLGGDDLFGLPLFGFGWLLLAWCIFGVCLLIWLVRRRGFDAETRSYLPLLFVIGAVIAFLLPQLEIVGPGGEKLGLPIRGYGVFLLAGVICGVSVALYLARRVGIDSEAVYSVAFWMFVFGIIGARLFFILQYWPNFQKPTFRATVVEMLKFTEGGLVVFGSVIGGLVAFVVVARWRKLPALKMADVIAPGMVLGLALGRFGCLMNGCCYGGVATDTPFSIQFPKYTSVQQKLYSPPYRDQLTSGRLHGIRLKEDDKGVFVAWVEPNSAAADSGLKAGERIREVNHHPISSMGDVRYWLALASREPTGATIALMTWNDRNYHWSVGKLPSHSLPVHPTQIYSSINATLLFVLLWAYFPYRTRDGQIFAILMTSYPITRFMLEIIRDDEHGQLGTSLTVSQMISVAVLIGVIGLWWHIARQPRLREGAVGDPGQA